MAEEHVRGRMPLESNPGNRNPAIPPVYDTTGKEDYRRVTPENPLPTKDKDLDERLTAIENKLDSVIENGAINTQLTGSNDEYELPVRIESNVEIINVFKGVEIPPGGTVRLDPSININKFSDILVQFRPGGSAIGFESYQIDSLWHQGNSSTPAFVQNMIDETNRVYNISSDWVVVMGVKTTISVKNRMEEEKTFSDLTV